MKYIHLASYIYRLLLHLLRLKTLKFSIFLKSSTEHFVYNMTFFEAHFRLITDKVLPDLSMSNMDNVPRVLNDWDVLISSVGWSLWSTTSILEPRSGKVYLIQNYVMKIVSDLRQVNGFLRVLRFSPPIKLTATI